MKGLHMEQISEKNREWLHGFSYRETVLNEYHQPVFMFQKPGANETLCLLFDPKDSHLYIAEPYQEAR